MQLNLYNILQEVLKEEVSPTDVADAIQNKYQVVISYTDKRGKNHGQRIIEPYAYGISKAGNPCLRAYQFSGGSKRGVPKWKFFLLNGITNWTPTDKHFSAEPRKRGWNAEAYNEHGDETMATVLTQVSFDGDEINPTSLYSPNDTLYRIRRQRQDNNNSTPININNIPNENEGPVNNDSTQDAVKDIKTQGAPQIDPDMLKRNLEITKQEKEKQGYNIKHDKAFTQRGPILPDNASDEQKKEREREMKRARDRKYDATTRKDLRWQRAADSRHLIPKKYREEENEL